MKEENVESAIPQMVSSILCTNASKNLEKQIIQELSIEDPEEISEELSAVIAKCCEPHCACRGCE